MSYLYSEVDAFLSTMWSPPLLLNLGCLCLGWRIARLWLRRGQVPERLLLGVVLTWLTWRDALDTLLLRPPRAVAEGDWVPTALQLTFHAAALPRHGLALPRRPRLAESLFVGRSHTLGV